MPKTSKLEPTWTKRVISAQKKDSNFKTVRDIAKERALDNELFDEKHKDKSPKWKTTQEFPEIGHLVRNGKQIFYAYVNGNYKESDSLEGLKSKLAKKEAGSEDGPMISQEDALYANGRSAIIKHEKGKYNLYSHTGKLLGSHPTREEAVSQEQAIEISKHKGRKEEDNYRVLSDEEIIKPGDVFKTSHNKVPYRFLGGPAKEAVVKVIRKLKNLGKKTADTVSPESEKKNYFADVDNEIDQDFDLDFPPYLAKDTKMKEIPTWKPNSPEEIEKREAQATPNPISVKVNLANGDSFSTRINATFEEAQEYYKNMIYTTENDVTGKETKVPVTSVELI